MPATVTSLSPDRGNRGEAPDAIASVPEIVAELHAGRMVILVDEEDRENEGDLVMAAEHVTPEAINFMARHGRGLICLTLTRGRCEQLGLRLMVDNNGSPHGTNFTVSIEAAKGVTTGISAADRARTVQAAVARHAHPSDIVQPGHIFPLMAQEGGVLVRAGHTEAGCDLAGMAGCEPAAVICEVLKEDGSMARLPDLLTFAREHGLRVGTIADLLHYRAHSESMIERIGERRTRTVWGELQLVVYRDKPRKRVHFALVHGDIQPETEVLVRVNEPTTVLDWLEVESAEKSLSVHHALERIVQAPAGVMLLLHVCNESAQQLLASFDSLKQIDRGEMAANATVKAADLRTFGIGAQMLKDLGVRKMRILGRPRRTPSIKMGFDLEITGYEV